MSIRTISSLSGLAIEAAARHNLTGAVANPSGEVIATTEIEKIKFEQWMALKNNSPQGSLELSQMMVNVEKDLPVGWKARNGRSSVGQDPLARQRAAFSRCSGKGYSFTW